MHAKRFSLIDEARPLVTAPAARLRSTPYAGAAGQLVAAPQAASGAAARLEGAPIWTHQAGYEVVLPEASLRLLRDGLRLTRLSRRRRLAVASARGAAA